MKADFVEIIEDLETDPNFYIKVVNANTNSVIANGANADYFVQNYGSIEGFFESLIQKQIRKITITPVLRRADKKNSFRPRTNAQAKTFELLPAQEKTEDYTPFEELEKPQENIQTTTNQTQKDMGMNLDIKEIIKLHVDSSEKVKLEITNQFLTEENKRLKQENDSYKEQLLENKFNRENKKANAEMLTGIAPMFLPLIERVLGSPQAIAQTAIAEAVGLNAATTDHETFFQKLNTYSEEYIRLLDDIIFSIQNKTGFQEELLTLLDKYNAS